MTQPGLTAPAVAAAQTIDRARTKRFTTPRKPVEFYIDDDLFECVRSLPAGTAMDMADFQGALGSAGSNNAKMKVIIDVFETLMLDQSWERFQARLRNKANPIDLGTLTDVVHWLFGEAYGLRPTQPHSPSVPGSPTSDSGPPSTDGARAAESTPSVSAGTGS